MPERLLQQHGRMQSACALSTTQGEAQMKSVLDPSFRYTKSIDTNLRKTFARIRREQTKQRREPSTATPTSVLPFRRGESAG